jgi:ankyrin repeat protein
LSWANTNALIVALGAGDPDQVRALITRGADIRFRSSYGYNAAIHAVYNRDIVRDARLIELLQILIDHGVDLNCIGDTYEESALRVLSNRGRFDAVRLLLEAGADASQLEWTPLIEAVVLGSTSDVEAIVNRGVDLEETEWWSRTAWHIAIQSGQRDKAESLRRAGARIDARGKCGHPPLFYAIENHHADVLQWLIDLGLDIEASDDFGNTALQYASEHDALECIDVLLTAGADVNRANKHEGTALYDAASGGVARRLLAAGADPTQLNHELQRALTGLPKEPDVKLLDVDQDAFRRGRNRRFGTANPEVVSEPFWHAMIRAGVNGYAATQAFHGRSSFDAGPVWCAQRFGQSLTFLPDGRIVQIGGEHEDYYDPDFCIYNDVFVHHPDGRIDVLAYPEADFAPTDFHTATLIGATIWIIGNVGYRERRRVGFTPIYRLDTNRLCIESVAASGSAPGWISRHRAVFEPPHSIRVSGGKLMIEREGKEDYVENDGVFVLDIEHLIWSRAPQA